jgi:PAS domain S-box-containing protein
MPPLADGKTPSLDELAGRLDLPDEVRAAIAEHARCQCEQQDREARFRKLAETEHRDLSAARRAERALQESETRFRLAAQSVADLIYEWDIKTDRLDWYGNVDHALGLPPGSLPRTLAGWLERVHPEDRARLAEAADVRRRVAVRILERYRVRHQDRSWRQWIDRGQPILDEMGRPVRWIGACNDITERVAAETALRQSEARWRSLTESSPDQVMLVDLDLRIQFINRGRAFPEGNLLGREALDFVSAEARDQAERVLRGVIASGTSAEYESDYSLPDGTLLRFSTRIQPILEQDRVVALVCSARDITHRREAESELRRHRERLEELVESRTAELRALNERLTHEVTARTRAQAALAQSEARYRGYLSQAPDGVFLTDAEGRYVDVNEAACRLTGFSREELLALSVNDLAAPPRREESLGAFAALKTEGHASAEVWLRRRGGGTVPVALDAVKIDDQCFMAFCKDIAPLKQAEQALRQLTARLNQVREEERSTVAREIHDELGQTLTGAKMDLAWLLQRFRKDQEPLRERCREALTLLDASLDSVRSLATRLRPAALDDLGLEAAVEWLAADFAKRNGIRCECEVTGEETVLEPERATAVFRIAQEALTNVARHARATQVAVRLHRADGRIRLVVSDDGKGIPADRLQGRDSLGLLGMRERASALGGWVEITSQAGSGTTVVLEMAAFGGEGR